MMYTIQDLRDGKCAVINDGTLHELKTVMREAFPDDHGPLLGTARYYFAYRYGMNVKGWASQNSDLPKQSVKDFLKKNYTIQDLAEGKCALLNDGTKEELNKVLKRAFPQDLYTIHGFSRYYFKSPEFGKWATNEVTSLPIQSVTDFIVPEFVLPKRWCLKVTEETYEVFKRFREIPGNDMSGYITSDSYGELSWGCWKFNLPYGYTEITLEQFNTHVLKQKEEKMDSRFPKKISQEEGRRIISNVCNDWKEKLLDKWSKDFVLLEFTVVNEDFYKEGRKAANTACNADHLHRILDDIFGKDEPEHEYKDGDLVWVKNELDAVWNLRFTTGKRIDTKLQCYKNQRKEGELINFSVHRPAPGIVLPED